MHIHILSIILSFFLFNSCTGAGKLAKAEAEKSDDVAVVDVQEDAMLGYDIGDMATDFSLMNIDDKRVSLSDYTDAKGFILTFTCNHCPYAVAYEDRLIALDKEYKSKGYPVIAINPNNPSSYPEDSFENMKVRAKDKGFTFPYLFDNGQKIYPQYGATKTPHTFVLQKTKKGNRVEYIGAIDDNIGEPEAAKQKYVEMTIDALLSGKEPSIRKTKAIGCTIKL